MKVFTNLKHLKVGGLNFVIREGTSDFKAIREVVIANSYQRKGFAIESGETWIDIGANCGAFSVLAASIGAKVVAFEPDPENASIARANVETNRFSNLVTLHEVGLTEKNCAGKAMFHRNTLAGNLWRNGLIRKWKGGETIKVKTASVEPYWIPSNCIKMDAEGIEMPILEKYADTRIKKLVFEWSFDIDPSLLRFEKIIERLKRVYPNVIFSCGFLAYAKKKNLSNWQAIWYPACRTVWCW